MEHRLHHRVYKTPSTVLSKVIYLACKFSFIVANFQPVNSAKIFRIGLQLYLLTPWCRVLLEKLTGLQLVKKFPAFHGTRRFITALTSVHYLSLSWASPIQSIHPHPTSWRSILILSTHLRLGLLSGLFPSDFPTKTLYTPLSSPIRATWSYCQYIYSRFHLRRSTLGILNLEVESTPLPRNVGHQSSRDAAHSFFFQKNATKVFLQKLVYQKCVSCYSVRPLIAVDFATPVNGPCCWGHGRVDFPLYASFQLGGICHHQTIAWFYAGPLCGHALAKLSLRPLHLSYVGLGRHLATLKTNGVRNT